jgi:hypothetical protein
LAALQSGEGLGIATDGVELAVVEDIWSEPSERIPNIQVTKQLQLTDREWLVCCNHSPIVRAK